MIKERDNIQKIGAIDIGNSRAKMLINGQVGSFVFNDMFEDTIYDFLLNSLFEGTEWENVKNNSEIEDALNYLFSNILQQEIILGVSCVNSENKKKIEELFQHFSGLKLIDIKPIAERQELLRYDVYAGYGIDRALGIIGAMGYSEPPLITVDCGTALTINPVTKDCVALGGTIGACAYLQLDILQEKAEQLKNVKLEYNERVSGLNTSHCISSGIIHGIAGGIKNIYNKIVEQEYEGNDSVPVYITGGASDLIYSALKDWEIKPVLNKNLVLEGILRLI
jgi:pantothenate kinase type III